MADATCEKCDQYYNDPRMLPCLHSFCLGCLEKELETQTSLHCPNCKEKITLAENGVAGLPQDLYLTNEAEIARISEKVEDADELCQACGRTDSTGKAVAYCIECKEYLCNTCEGLHGKREVTASHNLVIVGQRLVKTNQGSSVNKYYQRHMSCPYHKKYELEVYCKQCKLIICKNCMDFEHRQHRDECHLIEAVAKQEREALKACQDDTKEAVASLDAAIAKCKETMEQADARKKVVDTSITQSLDQVRNALLAQNTKVHSSTIAGLEAQVNELQRVRDGLASVSTRIDEAQTHSPAQLLATKNVLAERATKLQKEFQESNLPPCQSASFVTDISDPATISKIVSLGCVSGGGHPPSSICNAGYLPRSVVGKPCSIKVTAIDKEKKEVGKGGDDVAAKLVPLGSPEKATDGETSDNGDGTYTVTVTPQSTGEHDLHVTLANRHVKGSPFRYSITKPRETPYTSVTNQKNVGTYNYPYDVAMTDDGGFAVAEYGYQTVSLYLADGTRIHSFGEANSYGSEDGQFDSPSAVAIKGDIMYVCESGNYRIQKFSLSKRSFVSKFGRNGSGDGEFSSPHGICIDPEGRVFLSDLSNNCIQVFDGNDQFLYSFPCQQAPLGLAFDLEGHLHVAANSSNCIHVFTPDGTLITSYGTGTLSSPTGIAIDGQGYIAISEDGGNCCLWIYSPDLNLVHTIYGQYNTYGRGIACDKDGAFLVADYNSNQVQKFF